MSLIIGWLGFSVLVGVLATVFNRSSFCYFILAAVVSPIIAAIVLVCLGKKKIAPVQNTVNYDNEPRW